MEPVKRSKNFTEREKMLLIEVAKEFVSIIDNKKTDGTSVEAKKLAWMALTKQYNAVSETGARTEKQLHALYDNLKKKARKNISDDKSELYKTGGGTFCPKTTTVDEKIVALLNPQFKPLKNDYDSSAPYYYNLGIETQVLSDDTAPGTSEDFLVVMSEKEEVPLSISQLSPKPIECSRPISPCIQKIENTPIIKKTGLTEIKKKNINNLTASIIKRKNMKQINEDAIAAKKLEILEIQKQHELMKLEKAKTTLELDIELKKTLLEIAQMDLAFKKKNFSLV